MKILANCKFIQIFNVGESKDSPKIRFQESKWIHAGYHKLITLTIMRYAFENEVTIPGMAPRKIQQYNKIGLCYNRQRTPVPVPEPIHNIEKKQSLYFDQY